MSSASALNAKREIAEKDGQTESNQFSDAWRLSTSSRVLHPAVFRVRFLHLLISKLHPRVAQGESSENTFRLMAAGHPLVVSSCYGRLDRARPFALKYACDSAPPLKCFNKPF